MTMFVCSGFTAKPSHNKTASDRTDWLDTPMEAWWPLKWHDNFNERAERFDFYLT